MSERELRVLVVDDSAVVREVLGGVLAGGRFRVAVAADPIIALYEANRQRQPDLAEIAASAHLSEYHFQRLFRRWAGISPKRFLPYLTKEDAKRRLRESGSVLEAAPEAFIGLFRGENTGKMLVKLA